MAIALNNGTIEININILSQTVGDLETAISPFNYSASIPLTFGTGNNQAEQGWTDTRTVTAGNNDDIVLSSLTNLLGQSIAFTNVHFIMVHNKNSTASNVLFINTTGPAQPWVYWINGESYVRGGYSSGVTSGGIAIGWAPDSFAYVVTAGDTIRITNPGASDITYDIVIVGNVS